ncbi:MAG: MMPL family transporter [Pseudomonadota bacterium]|nr:MMPL family transporter [Pseudomonadota bacterium]
MLKDDANIVKFYTFRDLFGDAEYLTIGVEARPNDLDIFEAQTIKLIDEITKMLEGHEYVTKVSSLSNYQYIHDRDGILATENLFPEVDRNRYSETHLSAAREVIEGETLALNSLITEDFKNTRIVARTEYIESENSHKIQVSKDLYSFLKQKKYFSEGYKIRLGGSAIIAERFETFSKRDSSLLIPLVFSTMCLLLWVLFGSLLACILPWVLIISSVVILKAIQLLVGFPMTVVNSALTPTLMIIGMGASIHLITEFFSLRGKGLTPINATKGTINNLFKPIFFTALTTSIGFGALSVTELVPVRQYAFLSALGSLIILTISLTMFLPLLSFFPFKPKEDEMIFIQRKIEFFIGKIALFTFKRQKIISFISMGVVIFCLVTVPKISVDSNIFNYFKSDSWIKQDMRYFDKLYKTGGVEIVIDSGDQDGIKDPKFLSLIESYELFLNALPETGKPISVLMTLKQIRQAFNGDNQAFFVLPDSSAMTAQLLLLYSNSGPDDDLSDRVDFDRRFLRVSLPIKNLSAKEFDIFFNDLKKNSNLLFPSLKIDFTGPLVLYNAQEVYVNKGLKESFALALFLIALSFLFLFKSFKYGLVALFPSVLPILSVGGLTIFMGISLDLGTVIVGAMCMGIAVDDAIHVLSRYIRAKESGLTTMEAIDQAVSTSGKAVIFTSIILVCGFSTMLFASLVPTMLFGLFVALIMILAVLGDLLLLPALLFVLERRNI